eukprot:scaffold149258_cov21-Tisochrysis_lutea.AAC.1
MLRSPGVGQDKQRARRLPTRGLARPPCAACFSAPLRAMEIQQAHQGPSQQPKITRNITSRLHICTLKTQIGVSKREKCKFWVHCAIPEPHPGVPSMPNQTIAPNKQPPYSEVGFQISGTISPILGIGLGSRLRTLTVQGCMACSTCTAPTIPTTLAVAA